MEDLVVQTELVVTEIPLGDPRLREFVKLPWKLYRDDPCWTPPLNADLLGSRLLGMKGLLTERHPYHQHAEVTHFMAWRNKEPVGRVSAAINRKYNEYHNTSIGSFGFFEVINDYEVAKMLLDHAKKWVEDRGMSVLRGPGEYSNATHERQAILIDGFQYPPTVELTHNPPYYAELLEQYGFQKAKDYVAHMIGKGDVNWHLLERLTRKISEMEGFETRKLNFKKLAEEVRLIVHLYNEAWAHNWGFLPITDEEGDSLADTLRLIIDPHLVRFAFINGEPIGVMGILPDPNYALRPRWHWYGDSDLIRIIRLLIMRRRIPRTRGMFFGIKSEYRSLGIPVLLFKEVVDALFAKHYTEVEGSLMLEDNSDVIKINEMFGGKYYKRWRIYDLPLK
jgi:GNAT superfamily N-acetyltransferase